MMSAKAPYYVFMKAIRMTYAQRFGSTLGEGSLCSSIDSQCGDTLFFIRSEMVYIPSITVDAQYSYERRFLSYLCIVSSVAGST